MLLLLLLLLLFRPLEDEGGEEIDYDVAM